MALLVEKSSTRTQALRALLLLALAVTWGEFLYNVAFPAAFVAFWRQPAAWVAARLSVEGKFDVLYADGHVFGVESTRLGANPDIFAANAPTTVLPYLPLAWLPVDTARAIWVTLSVACFAVAIILLLRAARVPLEIGLVILALVPLYEPWRRNIYIGAPYAVALLFAVLGEILARQAAKDEQPGRNWSMLAGLAFAAGCAVRQFYGLALLLTPLVKRQWRVVAWALGLYLAAVAGTLAWMGSDVWVNSIQFSLGWREGPETALTAYQSLNDFLMHLFRYHPTLNPGPVVDAQWVVGPLWWVLSLGILLAGVVTIRNSERSGDESKASRLFGYALPVSLALLLSPVSEDYHYTLSLFPLVLAGIVLWERFDPRLLGRFDASRERVVGVALWAAYAASVVLLGAPWRFYNVPGTEGWHMLLYYPRLYGNVALLASGMVLLSSRFTWKRKVAQAEGSAVQAGLEPAIAGQLASKEQL